MHIVLDPTLGFIAGIAIAILILLALELFNNRRITKLTAPIYEFATKRAETEAEKIIKEAKEQARKILADAESSGMALTTSHQKDHEDAEKSYQGALTSMLESWQNKLGEQAKVAQETEVTLGQKAAATLEAEAQAAHQHMASTMTALEEEWKKRMEKEVAEAVANARAEATKNEEMRKVAVDSHIVGLIRETLRITLQKELPKEVHAELVRAALEEAKASGVF